MIDINLSPYTGEQRALDRRRRMAEAMQQQSAVPIEMPTMPGVRVSPYAGLAKILQGYIAGKELSRADEAEKDYENKASGETADFLSKMSQYETVPGDITSPAVPADITPAGTSIKENLDRQALMAYNYANTNQGMRLNSDRKTTYMPSSITGRQIQEASKLPLETTEDVINKPATPEERGPSQQRPVLNASFLDPTKPYAYKTGQVKQMLMQVLMQQEAQKQAAALRKQEAEQAIHAFNPEQNVGRIVNGRYVPLIEGQPKLLTEYQNYDLQLKDAANRVNAAKVEDVIGVKQEPYKLLPSGIPFGAVESGKQTPDGRTIYKKDGKFYVEGK